MDLAIPLLTPVERLQSARDYMVELLADAGIPAHPVAVPEAIRPSWVVLLRGEKQLVVAAFVRRGGSARFYGLFERPGATAEPGGTSFASDDDPGACIARVIHALGRQPALTRKPPPSTRSPL